MLKLVENLIVSIAALIIFIPLMLIELFIFTTPSTVRILKAAVTESHRFVDDPNTINGRLRLTAIQMFAVVCFFLGKSSGIARRPFKQR